MVHGFLGEPNGGWRPWLMGQLAKEDVWACALAMPAPSDPKKEEWVAEINRAVGEPSEDVFLVGHSLGVPAILRYLETLNENQKIGGAVLVSGPCNILDRPDNDTARVRKTDNFLDTPFNFEDIKKVCGHFVVIHGDNDNKVPLDHAKAISRNLGCELIIIPNGGHLGGSDGFKELPQALQALEKMF